MPVATRLPVCVPVLGSAVGRENAAGSARPLAGGWVVRVVVVGGGGVVVAGTPIVVEVIGADR